MHMHKPYTYTQISMSCSMIADSVQLLYIQYEMSRFTDVRGVKKPNFSGRSSLNAIHPTQP